VCIRAYSEKICNIGPLRGPRYLEAQVKEAEHPQRGNDFSIFFQLGCYLCG
jgi:hypothetical protein